MSVAGDDERRLVERLVAGDEGAFDLFAESYVPGLYRFAAARLTRDLDLVPDLVQTALAKAIERLESFRGESPLFTWLCACVKNEVASHYRRVGRRPIEIELEAVAGDGAAAEPPVAERRLLEIERSELVHAALDQVPARYARALEWKYLEGVSVAEIADRLGATPKAAESLLGRARVAFRDVYLHLDGAPSASRAEELR